MSAVSQSGSRFGSPSDYYSESESTGKGRSRIGRLTPTVGASGGPSTSSRPASRSASRPASRHGSDLAFGLHSPPATSRSSDNLRRG